MFIRALIVFITLPGIIALVIPLFIGFLDPWKGKPIMSGIAALCIGTCILLWCVRDFYAMGKGALTPWRPPKRLAILGLYRFVRNPMYIGILLVLSGWALFFCSPLLGIYTVLTSIGFHIWIVNHEEPQLHQYFGEEWEQYRHKVSRWLPGKPKK